MKTITLRLPWPPSINHYYGRSRRHVYLKEPGRLYRRKAALEFARLGWPRLEGPVSVHVVLVPPHRRRFDIDNPKKGIYDAISDRRGHRGIITDDSLIKEDSAVIVEPDPEKKGWVEVTISELS